MTTPDFTTTILVDQPPMVAFNAINHVRGWWSEEIEGGTEKLHDVFNYHYRDVHVCKMKLIEVVPGKKVVWLVLENYFKFVQDQSEWMNTKVSFDISEKENQTQIEFKHIGLVAGLECFDICSNAWTKYIQQSLYKLITTGQGEPNASETPRTEDERRLQSAD